MINITQNKAICGGAPCLNGTRFTVFNLINVFSNFDVTLPSVISDYELSIEVQDVKTILDYCANKKCLESDMGVYCEQCTLDNSPTTEGLEEPPVNGWELAHHLMCHYFPKGAI
ncbi:MAG: DUF433 domain-containing protein [Bacteroidetes bacterium]|nr:MAG: DUF433 domain-containing protein [Bacteroidota bacterium]